jgi:hypothetical protein
LRAIVLFFAYWYTSSRGLRMKTENNFILWFLAYQCLNKNITFTEDDFHHFVKDFGLSEHTTLDKYNISRIIYELQIYKQDLSPKDKLQKVFDYIQLLG